MVGNLALAANVLMRTRCVVRKGSLQTYSAFDRFDAWDDILGLHDFEPECIKAELDRRRLDPLHFQSDERAIGIAKDSHSIESRYEFTQQFKSEAPKIGLHVR